MKFSAVSQTLSRWAGSPRTFYTAVALILAWSLSGPYFHFNDTWQLIINTSTTIITFLMVFLIQNTQNRDNDIIHVKLDELIRATQSAQRSVLDLEAMDSKTLRELRKEYRALAARTGATLEDDVPHP